MRLAGLVLALLLGTAPVAAASPGPCEGDDAQAIHDLLERERGKAFRWDLGWGVVYAVAAGGEFALYGAAWNPFGEATDEFRAGALIGGIKASIGLASKLVLPMRIPTIPDPNLASALAQLSFGPAPDRCQAQAAANAALRQAAKRQQRAFYLNLLGGLAVNGAGALTLGLYFDTWKQAAVSFGSGLVASVLSLWTMPRGARRAEARRRRTGTVASVGVAPIVWPGGAGVAVAGGF